MDYLAQTMSAGNVPLKIFGTRLIGITPDNGYKLLISVLFIVAVVIVHWVMRRISQFFLGEKGSRQTVFWVRQGISIVLTIITLIGVLSIWFDDPTRLTTFAGLVTAGIAFALQKPISALAGYLVILRGETFGVGDRITMGGVRGDVVALRFTQTTIMEMGQPPEVQNADPAIWVHARQYTGRIVTVSNSKVFDDPVYNYTREFPYLWEELRLPISYRDDRVKAEKILLEVARTKTLTAQDLSGEAMKELSRRYFMAASEMTPRVYWRLTDNWIELTVRFITSTRGVRELKDAMSRDILRGFDAANIGIASSTYDVVGMPPLRVRLDGGSPDASPEQKPLETSA